MFFSYFFKGRFAPFLLFSKTSRGFHLTQFVVFLSCTCPVRPRREEHRLCWSDSTHLTWGGDHVLLWRQLFWRRQRNVWMLHLREVCPPPQQALPQKHLLLSLSNRLNIYLTFYVIIVYFLRNGEGHFKHRGKQPECEETKDPAGQKYRLRERYLRHHKEKCHFTARPPGIHAGIFKGNRFPL